MNVNLELEHVKYADITYSVNVCQVVPQHGA